MVCAFTSEVGDGRNGGGDRSFIYNVHMFPALFGSVQVFFFGNGEVSIQSSSIA